MVWEGMGMMGWRRRRDSNPRYALSAYNGLANRRLQPLGHVSGQKLLIIHWPLGQCRNLATCARSENSATRRDTKRDTTCSRWVPGPKSWIVHLVAPRSLVISYRGVSEACALPPPRHRNSARRSHANAPCMRSMCSNSIGRLYSASIKANEAPDLVTAPA
jgi:hypothetical protein